VHLSDYVTADNCKTSLKLRGLPFNATKSQIVSFFGNFNVDESKVIIDVARGRPTGYALVFLQDEEEAARAK